MTFLLGSFIAFIIVHLFKGQTKIINVLRDILKSRGIIKNKNHSKEKAETKKEKEEEKEEIKIDKRKVKRNYTTKHKSTKYHDIKPENLNAPLKRNNMKKSQTMKVEKMITSANEILNKKDEYSKIKMENSGNNNKKEKNKKGK